MKRGVLMLSVAIVSGLPFSPAFAAQPRGGPGGPPGGPPVDRAEVRVDRGEVVESLKSRIEWLDSYRGRLAAALARIESGDSPEDALGPMELRLLSRRPGEGQDWMAGGPGGIGLSREWPVGRPGPAPGPVPEPALEDVRSFIRRHLPQLSERIELAGEDNPEAAERMLRRMAPRFGDIIERERDDPAFARMRVEEMRIGMEIVEQSRTLRRLDDERAAPERVEEARSSLRQLLGRQLDLREKLETHRLSQMEREIAEARAGLRERAGRREQILDQNFERVLNRTMRGPRDEPGWRGRGGPPDRDG